IEGMAQDLRAAITTMERGLSVGLDQIEREIWQLRDAAEQLRLVAVSTVFPQLERIARDAADSVSKRVGFEASGHEVRLDSHVLSVIQPGLVQLVRNAVAHGIESGEERKKAGKPSEGHVYLRVSRRGDKIVFACQDDGKGLDVEAVRRAAQKRGLLPKDGGRLSAEELFQVLLRGGLTTSGTVTQVSGRGVGLDVVREAVSGLGGEVAIRTEGGKGMTVEISVPASRAGMEALVVEAGGLAAVIPLDSVRRTVRLQSSEVTRSAEGEVILDEAQVIPFVPLARYLRTGARREQRRHWSAVVVGSGSGVVAVGVDRLLGTANVVMRPLPPLTPAAPVVAGMSLDAQGLPQVVLDPEALIAAGRHKEPVPEAGSEAALRPILIVDDSLTTRMLEQSILESAGYRVDLATSGEEALQRAHRERYGLFLVDVEMPGMDGFAFVERTRADPSLREIPAILVTSRSSEEDRRRGKEVGAAAYVVKSEFNQEELLAVIRRLLRSS
ncbi:MAG: response regulator, partial [Bdellovibrionota bacterium]